MKDLTRRGFMKSVAATTAGLGMGSLGNVTLAFADDEDSSSEVTTYTAAECYEEGYNICVNVEAEGAVLLKNADDVLPLAEGTKVTLLGSMSYNYVIGGDGQGDDDSDTVMMNDAFTEAGLDINSDAWEWLKEQCGGARDLGDYDPSGAGNWAGYDTVKEFSIDVYEGATSSILADGYTDYAIVTIARSGAEGAAPPLDYDGDGSTITGSTYLEVDDNEKDLLAFCAANFSHTIVLVNTGNAMELGFLDSDSYNIDAALLIGMPGEAGLVGVGTLLTGRNNPSGRLVDTYAYDVTTNPTYYNTDDNRYANADNQTFYQYEEGIYVGYRYYETADAVGYFDSSDFTSISFKNGTASGYDQVVQFPFGYGLSYTTFTEEITASDVALEAGGTNSVTVTVTNTGSAAGKRVVELYMDAPYQTDTENFGIKGVGLEKSKVVLIGFEKTSEIEAGASEDVTITFDTDDLASFDNFGQGCYVLEAGTYKFNVQSDAHQWGDEGSDNAPSSSISVDLAASIIYDDEGDVDGATYAGARSSDKAVAKNCLDDLTAGDGCMLDGYLSRNDIAGGMATIMEHTSDEDPNEYLRDEAVAALAVSGTDSYEYTFETYIKGEKTTLSKTLYNHGADMMPFASETPDGTDVTNLDWWEWDKTYYVLEGETDDDGNIVITEEEPTDGSSYHKLTVDDMEGVDIDTESGAEIWDALACECSIDEAIEAQGNCGWAISAISSVGMPALVLNDAFSEANIGKSDGGTFFPGEPVLTATWNRDLAVDNGVAHAHQDTLFGIDVAYGPGMNTHRSPFGGRNYEYFAEDGFVAGEMGGSWVKGLQSQNVGCCCKHCGLNDGDTNRNGNLTWANEQAVREIYQRPFEIAIKKYAANGIMGSMNRSGLQWMSYGLFVTMMRDEWNFHGFFQTDSDGTSGDAYNSPQTQLCSRGAMLTFNCYIDDAQTVAAYGDATSYAYGNNMLHEVVRDLLYQYCGTKVIDEEGNSVSGTSSAASSSSSSSSSVPVAAIAGGVVAVAAVAAIAAVAVNKKKKGAAADGEEKPAKAKAAEAEDEDEDDESQA